MKAKPLPLVWFYDDVFKANYWVCVGPHERLLATLDKFEWPRDLGGGPSAAKTIPAPTGSGCLFWFCQAHANNTCSQLHEAFHAGSKILLFRGVEPEAILDETGAYYVEWVFNALRVALKKVKRG